MIQALDPLDAGWDFSELVERDRTAEIAESVAITESGGTDVIDSIASGATSAGGDGPGVELLCPAGTRAWIAHARSQGRSLAAVTPLGSRLPKMLWAGYLDRIGVEHSASDGAELEGVSSPLAGHELVRIGLFDDLVGPNGLEPLNEWAPDCPDVAEIARF